MNYLADLHHAITRKITGRETIGDDLIADFAVWFTTGWIAVEVIIAPAIGLIPG